MYFTIANNNSSHDFFAFWSGKQNSHITNFTEMRPDIILASNYRSSSCKEKSMKSFTDSLSGAHFVQSKCCWNGFYLIVIAKRTSLIRDRSRKKKKKIQLQDFLGIKCFPDSSYYVICFDRFNFHGSRSYQDSSDPNIIYIYIYIVNISCNDTEDVESDFIENMNRRFSTNLELSVHLRDKYDDDLQEVRI